MGWTSAYCGVMIMTDAPLVLALDTSTVVNVGLARGDQVLATATVADQMAHVEQLMPLVSECVDAAGVRMADLDQARCRAWPGAVYRPAGRCRHCAGAQLRAAHPAAWCLQSRRASRAIRWTEPGEFVVATDARRREVYWARYSRLGVRLEEPQSVTAQRSTAAAGHWTRRRPLR